MWAILVSGYCSNLYPVLDREAHTMWLSLHFLTMIIGPKHRIEMKEFVLPLSLQSVLLSKKKSLNRFHQKANLPHVRPTDKLFSKNEVTTKGQGVGCVWCVVDEHKKHVCVLSPVVHWSKKSSWNPASSFSTTANPTLHNQSLPDKTLCRALFLTSLFSLFCAEPCFLCFYYLFFCAEPCGATRRKARATSSRKATSSNCSHSPRLVVLWFVLGSVYWLFVITLSSWCFLPDWQTLCLLLNFHKHTKLWFMVWFDSFEIFLRVRANEQFSWPIFASPELEFKFYFWSLHYKGILPQKFT